YLVCHGLEVRLWHAGGKRICFPLPSGLWTWPGELSTLRPMLVHFRQLAPPSEAGRLRSMTEAAREFFVRLEGGQQEEARRALSRVDPRLCFESLDDKQAAFVLLRWDELPAYPAAQLVQCLAPAKVKVQLGRAPIGHEAALELVLHDQRISLAEG